MPLPPTLPIAAAAGPLALQAARGLSQGLTSFADLLRRGERDDSASGVESEPVELTTPQLRLRSPLRPGGLDNTKQETQAALERFGRTAFERLNAAGIDTSMPIRLQSDGGKGLLVGGDHPQRALIEQAFAEDPELVRAFNELMARLRLQQRLDEARSSRSFRLRGAGRIELLLCGDKATVQFE